MPRNRRRAANGRSSVSYVADRKVWRGYVSCGTDPDSGKRDRRTVTAPTESECWGKVEELERERRRGARRRPKDTVEAWIEQWLDQCELDLKPKTVYGYRSLANAYILPRLGDVRLDDLTPEDVERMLAWMVSPRGPQVSPTTAGNARRTLKVALNAAIKRGRLTGPNPAAVARSPRVPHQEVEPLSISEVQAVLTAARDTPNAARWTVGLALGLRQGEALGLQLRDVDLDAKTLRVRQALRRGTWHHGCRDPKACAATHCVTGCPANCMRHPRRCPRPCREGCRGHADLCPRRYGGGLVLDSTKTDRGRVLALPDNLAQELRTHIATIRRQLFERGVPLSEDTPLFPRWDGTWTDPRRDWGAWKDLLAAAGIPHTRLHTARHTAASMLLAEGVSPRVVMDVLGWSQISLTVRYQHVVDPLRRDAAARVGDAIWGSQSTTVELEGSG